MSQTPSIGRTVLYVPTGAERGATGVPAFPALVTRALSPTCVNLQVLPDMGLPFFVAAVTFSDSAPEHAKTRTWCWPPRVGA